MLIKEHKISLKKKKSVFGKNPMIYIYIYMGFNHLKFGVKKISSCKEKGEKVVHKDDSGESCCL